MIEENIKYTIYGEEVIAIQEIKNGWLVKYFIQLEDNNGCHIEQSEPRFYSGKLYDTPPIKIVSEEVSKFLEEKDRLANELQVIRNTIFEAKHERDRLIEKFKLHPALEKLEMLLDGKITHFLQLDDTYGICLHEIQKETWENEFILKIGYTNWNKGHWDKLKMHWEYYIKNCGNKIGILCSSYEESIQHAKKYIEDNFLDSNFWNTRKNIMDFVKKYDIQFSNEITQKMKEEEEKYKKERRYKIEEQIRLQKKYIDSLEKDLKQYE